MADHQHWLDRWKENRLGFHEAAVNQYLQAHLPRFDLDPGARIFLPLCGKALDMLWLAEQGYEVIGIELSEIALRDFFDENQLDYERIESDRFVVFRSGRIELLQGDFFDLRRDDLDGCALVYDRAALIACAGNNAVAATATLRSARHGRRPARSRRDRRDADRKNHPAAT